VKEGDRMYLEKMKSAEFWDTVRTDESYRFLIDDLLSLYARYGQGELPDISYDAFMHYHRTGSRHLFETDYYFPRRQRMTTCALLSLIYPDNEEYFSNLCNTIWAILNECSWSLPNHDPRSALEYSDDYIDLFAAETGYAISEIRLLFRDRFDPVLNARITHALDRRIIRSFIEHAYGWETVRTNWAAVCAGSVAVAFMRERPDLYPLIRPRIDAAMEAFLSGFRDDGVCQEGFAYWSYGFGFFLCYAHSLLEFTGGERDLFKNEKVKKIAQFPNCVYLSGNSVISFSDGGRTGLLFLGAANLLRHHYGDILPHLPKEFYCTSGINSCWCQHAMSFAYFDPALFADSQPKDEEYLFAETGWYVRKNALFGFAAKAGNNDEPHNHNDIGSFILAAGGEQVLADLGCGEYNRDYFSSRRYTILCNRSLGHSVPLLDGFEQCAGAEYAGLMRCEGERVLIDMTGAYPVSPVQSCLRRFDLKPDGFDLADTFSYAEPCPVMERFVSLMEPEISGNRVLLCDAELCAGPGWSCKISREQHSVHASSDTFINVYMIDFYPEHQGEESFLLSVRVK